MALSVENRGAFRRLYFVGLFMFFFLLFTYTHESPTRNVTSLSRLDLLHALFQEGRMTIDTYHHNTPDKAAYAGSFYSDKPPGTVVVALPGFAIAVGALRLLGLDLDSQRGWLLSSWTACALSIGLVSGLGACAFFDWLCGWVAPKWAFVGTCGLFLGAAPLPYNAMMFSHALVVSLICIALWVKGFGLPQHRPPESSAREILAGFCCGLALASEFTAGLVVVGLTTAFYQDSWHKAWLFALGALPALLLIPAYNLLCFGNALTLGYAYQASFPDMRRGLFGVQLPAAGVALQLLFNPAKGLFIWSPFLLLAIPGFRRLFTGAKLAFWTCLLLPLIQVAAISGYRWDWPAGLNLTPRYLAPITPFLALPATLALERFRVAGTTLVVISILIIGSATLLDPSPPFDPEKSYFSMYIPKIAAGKHAPNIGTLLGLRGLWTCLPFAVMLATGMIALYRGAKRIEPSMERPQAHGIVSII